MLCSNSLSRRTLGTVDAFSGDQLTRRLHRAAARLQERTETELLQSCRTHWSRWKSLVVRSRRNCRHGAIGRRMPGPVTSLPNNMRCCREPPMACRIVARNTSVVPAGINDLFLRLKSQACDRRPSRRFRGVKKIASGPAGVQGIRHVAARNAPIAVSARNGRPPASSITPIAVTAGINRRNACGCNSGGARRRAAKADRRGDDNGHVDYVARLKSTAYVIIQSCCVNAGKILRFARWPN